jgi:hypothetical protein
MAKRRKPTSAAARANISRALKGKKRGALKGANKALFKLTGKKLVSKKDAANKKKAVGAGLAITGGLAGAALLASKRKGAPGQGALGGGSVKQGLLAAGGPEKAGNFPGGVGRKETPGNGTYMRQQPDAPGPGVGRREQTTRQKSTKKINFKFKKRNK